MPKLRSLVTCAGLLLAGIGFASPASAQATRTWVSGVGDDVNPCSRTAPCKTFAGAISKTAAGGEINCLDPGGFGAVSIVKSMTISCAYTEGGALAGGNGITVNMPSPSDVAVIRGLDIFGVNPPGNGIRFVNNGTLIVEDTVIRRFNAANSHGVSFQPSGPSHLIITNTTIADNGNGASGGGILVQPTGAAGSARVFLQNVRVLHNANAGLRVDTTGVTSEGVTVTIDDSSLVSNGSGISLNQAASAVTVLVSDSVVANNEAAGIAAAGGAKVRIGGTRIHGNHTGISGTVNSFGNNVLEGNRSSDGVVSPAQPK